MAGTRKPRVAATRRKKNLPDDYQLASEVDEKLIRWLIDQRLAAGVITLIAGRPGQGKSLFTSWLAAHLTQAGDRVLFSNLEDMKGETTRPRLRVAGADLSKVSFWTPDLQTPEGLVKLEAVVTALKVKLLILDPITGHMTRRAIDSRLSINPIRELCERTGLSIVAIHHTRKALPKNAHPIDWVKGAGDGMLAAARMVYIFGRNVDDPDERLLVHAKTNISDEGSMTFAFDLAETQIEGEDVEIGRLLLIDPLSAVNPTKIADDRPGKGGKDGGDDTTKRAVATDWLTSLLMFGEMHSKDIDAKREEAGITARTLRRAREELGCVKREEHRGYGKGRDYWWRLPDNHPALELGKKARKAAKGELDDTDGELTVEDILNAIDRAKGDDDDAA
jgi:hypothetical protein